MTDKTNAELIAEAKSRAQLCDADTREVMRDTGNIVARLAAALEAAERERDRLDEAFDRDLPWRYDEVEAQRNQLAAVVGKVRAACDKALAVRIVESSSSQAQDAGLAAVIRREALATAPADALREHDAKVWDAAFAAGVNYDLGDWEIAPELIRNPYREGQGRG